MLPFVQGWQFAPRFNPSLAGWSDRSSLIRIVRRRRWLRLKQSVSQRKLVGDDVSTDVELPPGQMMVCEHGVRQLAPPFSVDSEAESSRDLGRAEADLPLKSLQGMLDRGVACGTGPERLTTSGAATVTTLEQSDPDLPALQAPEPLHAAGWKKELLGVLARRDEAQVFPFKRLTAQYNDIAAREQRMRAQNYAYASEVRTLHTQNAALQSSLQMVNENGVSGEKLGSLQQQVFTMQAELLDAYKDRSKVAEMQLKVHHTEQSLAKSSAEVTSLENEQLHQAQISLECQSTLDQLRQRLAALETDNKDLRLELAQTQTNARQVELQLLEQKQKAAEYMNDMNGLVEHTRREAANKIRAASITAEASGAAGHSPDQHDAAESGAGSGGMLVPQRISQRLSAGAGEIYCVATSMDGRWVAAGSGDKHLRVWDIATGQPKYTLSGLNGAPLCCSFSPSSNFIAASGKPPPRRLLWVTCRGCSLACIFTPGTDSTIRMWSITTGRTSAALNGHREKVLGMAFVSEERLVTGRHFFHLTALRVCGVVLQSLTLCLPCR